MTPPNVIGSSATPTQNNLTKHARSMSNQSVGEAYGSGNVLQPPSRDVRDGRSMSNANVPWGPRGASLAASGQPPGSFSSDLKTLTLPRMGTPRAELGAFISGDYTQGNMATTTEQRQTELRDKITKETKIKVGSENLLEALISKNAKQTKDQRQRVETELSSSNYKIAELKSQLNAEIEKANRPSSPTRARISSLFQGSPLKSPSRDELSVQEGPEKAAPESESPSYVLSEILQALEVDGMQADYYVERANNLVDLFKRYPSLKYDLAWAIFGDRVQTMLLSENRDVIAAGYRVTRQVIADRASLQTIRGLHIDSLIMLSLVKDDKASIEREQALKLVRAFLDVKNGVQELSNAVLRTVVSVAEHHEDRLRNMALLTMAEVLVRDPKKALTAGSMSPLADALAGGTYNGSESLAIAFLHLADSPRDRVMLRSGQELAAAFTSFTDPLAVYGNEERLKSSARLISTVLKTWPGVFTLSGSNFSAFQSLLSSLSYPAPVAREILLDLLFDVLCIKPPSWTSSFLAGRRLTTYGRVAKLTTDTPSQNQKLDPEDENNEVSLVDHFTTLLLAIFVHCGVTHALSDLIEDEIDLSLRRKATLLLSEILKLANHSLPGTMSASLQVMPALLQPDVGDDSENAPPTTGMIYQIDSVNRTLNRSGPNAKPHLASNNRYRESYETVGKNEAARPKLNVDMDDLQFRSLVLETQVLSSSNYLKWKWDLIMDIVEGPLLNPKRLDDAVKATKFLKRLTAFYRPFKHRFADVRNTKPNQRYVRGGCALLKTLLQTSEGISYLAESKLLRQLGECIAQLDPLSGLISEMPIFSPYRVSETLSGGYFALLGVLSGNPQGLQMIERWRMINMFYHIMDLEGRDDLVQALLGNMDFTLDSHLRVMLSKALTACPKGIRIYATRLLRKYVTTVAASEGTQNSGSLRSQWAIRLLVTQLYDPEVQVCETAVQILEEACNRRSHLEYVVQCRPALDHLGEIGAPLLLRFLSTSLGYQYLDGLDYIGQEMDDWFLGRNATYVTLVEASLSRALFPQIQRPRSGIDEPMKTHEYGIVPPHFYRELTRTVEGCRLLSSSGHFDEFVATIQNSWSEAEDLEVMLKVKGCLWAVGNIGSMELGAPFLEETNVVEVIVKIATSSEVMTMRGTAFFVLGLISRSLHGMEILAEYGWHSATDATGRSLGFCLPPDLKTLLSLGIRPAAARARSKRPLKSTSKTTPLDEDPLHSRILSLAVDLGNTVLAKKAAGDLYSIKNKSPEQFSSVELFRKVTKVLETHAFRLQVRRFILDLFDKSVMTNVVLDDEDDDGEPGER
ncbi:MAG: hypothetical protein Q9191_006183 [Dirinaria sp. TL-2023a]